MQFITVFVALFAAAVSAAPASAPVVEVEKRACQYVAPSTPGLSLSKGSSQTVRFSVPTSAVGACQLEVYFPAGFQVLYSNPNPSVNVYDVNGNAPGSLVGTVTLASDPSNPTRRFVNSFGCRPNMQYRFELAPEAQPGAYVYYPPVSGAGLRMSHSC